MKLRIKGNTLRFRLTKSEVSALHDQGWWQDATSLGGQESMQLLYRIEKSTEPSAHIVYASGRGTLITATVPEKDLAAWADSGQIGLYFEEIWGLKVAIEKDFRCLDEKRDEDESDNFDHPLAGSSGHLQCSEEDVGED